MKNSWIITDENDENLRLDSHLSELFENYSRSFLQKIIKEGKVLVNNEVKKNSYKLRLEDKIDIEIIEEKEQEILPQNINLDIVWENEDMAVVNKPSGMLTHPTALEKENTLVNALLFKYGDNLSDMNGLFRRGILHRLDRNTSGMLMIAKNNKTHEFLASQIKKRLVEKKYLAVVKGVIQQDSGRINLPIGRNPNQPHKMAIVEEADGGKPSLTEFKVIKRFKEHTFVELDLKTGRTHQIRVHLSSLKHPIVNDSLYGGGSFKVKTEEQVLQSYKLSFTKPFSNDIIELELEPDEKIQKVLRYLESK